LWLGTTTGGGRIGRKCNEVPDTLIKQSQQELFGKKRKRVGSTANSRGNMPGKTQSSLEGVKESPVSEQVEKERGSQVKLRQVKPQVGRALD